MRVQRKGGFDADCERRGNFPDKKDRPVWCFSAPVRSLPAGPRHAPLIRPCGRAGAWLRRRRGAAHGGAARAGVSGPVRTACGPGRTALPTGPGRSGGARMTSGDVWCFIFREFLHIADEAAIGGRTHIARLVFRPFAWPNLLQLFTAFRAFHGASSCVHFVTVCRELRRNGAGPTFHSWRSEANILKATAVGAAVRAAPPIKD